MTPWTQVWLLAKREFVERGRSKPFLVTMAIIAVVVLAIGPLVDKLGKHNPAKSHSENCPAGLSICAANHFSQAVLEFRHK